ncbi:hypothetical protein JD844_000213 [Phrynosoma platyrhinos]|uniref:Centromere protein N n=1 Tax=Phrynosoma platyrhinos TaxID=52577 RepID=A0ABQ7SQ90_PHRPL|nr:hypothetical protein JD844_000213 [Phrynosoma platyrhinos]
MANLELRGWLGVGEFIRAAAAALRRKAKMGKRRSREDCRQNSPSKVFVMDDTVAEYIRRTVLRIPCSETVKMLTTWKFLSDSQLKSLNINQKKENVSQEVVQLCEIVPVKQLHLTTYNYTYRDKKLWSVYQMTREEGDENYFFDLANFKKKFKENLQSPLKNVTINFKEYEDNAIWIRIAWGTQHTKPNQYKPTYVVYQSQTPYVFISHSIYKRFIPMLCQALLVAASYSDIHEMELRSHCLDSLKDIVFKRCSQSFQTHHLRPLQEKNSTLENAITVARSDTEQLETTFRSEQENGILNDKEPFRCMVKFSSPHLLEALQSLAPAGLADAPLSPLLTCITQKARNYFKIRERKGPRSKSFSGQ